MAEEAFQKLWTFEEDEEVCIKHFKKEFLRVDGDDNKGIDWDGKIGGGKAKWKTKKIDDNTVAFQSVKTEKWLRIQPDGTGWDCKGKEDGDRTKFKIIPYAKGSFMLHTLEEQDGEFKYLGCKNKDPMPIQIFSSGEKEKFSTPWNKGSEKKEIVIIQHSGMKNLKLKKDDIESNGGNGEPCQWKLILQDDNMCRLKNMKGDGFLRIKKGTDVDAEGGKDGAQTEFKMIPMFEDDDMQHHIYLQSVKHEKYIGVTKNGKVKPFDEQCEQTRFALFTEE